MALACLICHSVDSPSHSFRSYSISSSDDEGRCAKIVSCIGRKVTLPGVCNAMTSKVAPDSFSSNGHGASGSPRLIRSRAVTRDLVRDWNFDEITMDA